MNEFKQDIEKAERIIVYVSVCGAVSSFLYIMVAVLI